MSACSGSTKFKIQMPNTSMHRCMGILYIYIYIYKVSTQYYQLHHQNHLPLLDKTNGKLNSQHHRLAGH